MKLRRVFFVLVGLANALLYTSCDKPSQATSDHAVIYGTDHRRDLYQVRSQTLRRLANATVALLNQNQVVSQGEFSEILTQHYGRSQFLCADEPFYHQGSAAFCSGALIAPDIVVTAGHCIRSVRDCASTRFVFGFNLQSSTQQGHRVRTSDVFSCKEILHTELNPRGADYAIIRLDRPSLDRQPLRIRSSGTPTVGTPLFVMGHPSGLPLKIAGGARIRSVQETHFTANLDTYGGNSGSPVVNATTLTLEGVLVRGDQDYVVRDNCLVSQRCPDEGCRGEDVSFFKLPVL